MNIILFHSSLLEHNRVVIREPRIIDHVRKVIKPSPGDTLKAGELNGMTGAAKIELLSQEELILRVNLDASPPPEVPCTLLLAMPRPKVLKRTIQAAVTMGVKSIHIIKTWRVEKSYFDSPTLFPENLEHQAILGLEQAGDTILPDIQVHHYFKPFFEDHLPFLSKDRQLYIAHPYGSAEGLSPVKEKSLLAIGPEGGFIQYELDRFFEAGFKPVSMGERILRVEQAVPAFLSRMYY